MENKQCYQRGKKILYTGWHRPLCMWNMLSMADWMFSLASNTLYVGWVGVNTMLIYCTVRKIWSLSSQRVRTYRCNPLDSVYSIFAVKLSYSTCSHPPVCSFHFVLFHRFLSPPICHLEKICRQNSSDCTAAVYLNPLMGSMGFVALLEHWFKASSICQFNKPEARRHRNTLWGTSGFILSAA